MGWGGVRSGECIVESTEIFPWKDIRFKLCWQVFGWGRGEDTHWLPLPREMSWWRLGRQMVRLRIRFGASASGPLDSWWKSPGSPRKKQRTRNNFMKEGLGRPVCKDQVRIYHKSSWLMCHFDSIFWMYSDLYNWCSVHLNTSKWLWQKN